ncbi:hypothetical protein ACFYS8_34440 [Kitasatospora sp. NPDC004615]
MIQAAAGPGRIALYVRRTRGRPRHPHAVRHSPVARQLHVQYCPDWTL